MSDAYCIGPFAIPWPNRGQERVSTTKKTSHWSQRDALVKQQRAIVAAAFGGPCTRCGQLWKVCQIQPGRGRPKRWIELPCSCRAPRHRPQLPPHGPEHPVDMLLVRIPRVGASLKGLDWDGAIAGAKALIDENTVQLWPRDPVTRELLGDPDDSAPWLRWHVEQRPHRKARPPRKLPPGWVPGPPDPPNQGTELCEIWIAPREDCCPDGVARTLATWQRCLAVGPAAKSIGGLLGMQAKRLRDSEHGSADWALADLIETIGETGHVGCDRSRLPIRWARGEL